MIFAGSLGSHSQGDQSPQRAFKVLFILQEDGHANLGPDKGRRREGRDFLLFVKDWWIRLTFFVSNVRIGNSSFAFLLERSKSVTKPQRHIGILKRCVTRVGRWSFFSSVEAREFIYNL